MTTRSKQSLYCALFLLITLFITACGAKKPEEAIIGQWAADLGKVVGLSDHTYQVMEFFKDGTATSRTEITNFVGNWKFIADDTIRIDWKEQGLFQNSPTQIFKVKFENDKMILLNSATGASTTYLRPGALLAEVQQGTATVSVPTVQLATPLSSDKLIIRDSDNILDRGPIDVIAQQLIGRGASIYIYVESKMNQGPPPLVTYLKQDGLYGANGMKDDLIAIHLVYDSSLPGMSCSIETGMKWQAIYWANFPSGKNAVDPICAQIFSDMDKGNKDLTPGIVYALTKIDEALAKSSTP